jgi:hypothetical protein
VPDWNELVDETSALGTTHDIVRRKYLRAMTAHTGRNVIVYYSAWLQKSNLARQGLGGFEVNDLDKNGFMAAIYGLDTSMGLDLMLHTPGGDIAATESLVDYLRQKFGANIRAIVPQLALSAGTMIALSCGELIMGRHSSLGPIDPQLGGAPARAIVDEWNRAHAEIAAEPSRAVLWQLIIGKYPPGLIGAAEHAIEWATEIVTKWLCTGMLSSRENPSAAATAVVDHLGSVSATKSHNRHLSPDDLRQLGLEVISLENDQVLQEAVLTVHHACMLTMAEQPVLKLIENQNGISYNQTYELNLR